MNDNATMGDNSKIVIIIYTLLENHWFNFNNTWLKATLGEGVKFVQMKD